MAFKVRQAHWDLIISFLENHKDLATGRFSGPNARDAQKKLWIELSSQLNSLGYGERTPDKWQKTWTDYKYLLKKKASSKKKKDLEATGGGETTMSIFTELELRALSLLGESFYKGASSEEIAVTKPIHSNAAIKEIPFRQPTTHEPIAGSSKMVDHDYLPTPKKRKRNMEEEIPDVYKETLAILRDIKKVVETGLDKISDKIGDLAAAINQKSNKES